MNRNKAYIGANYRIQGTAAGILKRAQVRVADYFKRRWKNQIYILMPVHDEIIIEYPRKLLKFLPQVKYDVSKLMTYMSEINVKLDVEWEYTTSNWNETKELKL